MLERKKVPLCTRIGDALARSLPESAQRLARIFGGLVHCLAVEGEKARAGRAEPGAHGGRQLDQPLSYGAVADQKKAEPISKPSTNR